MIYILYDADNLRVFDVQPFGNCIQVWLYESFLSVDPDPQNQLIQLPSYNRKLMMVAVQMRKEILFYWLSVGYKLNEASISDGI